MEKEVYEKIIQKKEFSQIPKEDVEKAYGNFDKPRYVEEEKVKLTRDLLRKTFSGFGGQRLLNWNFGSQTKKSEEDVLKKHLSTRERFEFYDMVYPRLLKWFDSNQEEEIDIFDLGAGVNGFSYSYFEKFFIGKVNYVAVEAVGQLVDLMNSYFKSKKISGKAYHLSLFNQKKVLDLIKKGNSKNKIKTRKLILMLKVIDALESFERNYTLDFLRNLKKILNEKDVMVVSFATESWIRRKKFFVQRNWLINFIREEFEFIDDFNPQGERYLVFRKK